MNKINLISVMLIGQILFSCGDKLNKQTVATQEIAKSESVLDTSSIGILYKSEDLVIRKISNHIYEHTTFLETSDFGIMACNGMIVVNDNEVVIFDTPTNDQNSKELIQYLREQLKWKINAIVATNFHRDCLGGLKAFHRDSIPSYGSNKTIILAKSQNFIEPQQGFDKQLTLSVGDKKVYVEYFGEGHTKDNIIGYFPDDKAIFGGGLIKEEGAMIGNLTYSNTDAWSKTVHKIKLKYPQIKIVIPGHGEFGGPELLDYTINLFK